MSAMGYRELRKEADDIIVKYDIISIYLSIYFSSHPIDCWQLALPPGSSSASLISAIS